eukprot:TRINITY_DN28436_c0_g1_i2.p1 TRINITY_DN28436_c0_g1~~TRINITY_DN28436_c0_g1_i2.p1  ORF type:complete len:345 (-),score=97.97 TRINITY_DN28436_c0_g1_i2:134-1168(-)
MCAAMLQAESPVMAVGGGVRLGGAFDGGGQPSPGGKESAASLQQKMLRQRQLALERQRNMARNVFTGGVAQANHQLPPAASSLKLGGRVIGSSPLLGGAGAAENSGRGPSKPGSLGAAGAALLGGGGAGAGAADGVAASGGPGAPGSGAAALGMAYASGGGHADGASGGRAKIDAATEKLMQDFTNDGLAILEVDDDILPSVNSMASSPPSQRPRRRSQLRDFEDSRPRDLIDDVEAASPLAGGNNANASVAWGGNAKLQKMSQPTFGNDVIVERVAAFQSDGDDAKGAMGGPGGRRGGGGGRWWNPGNWGGRGSSFKGTGVEQIPEESTSVKPFSLGDDGGFD